MTVLPYRYPYPGDIWWYSVDYMDGSTSPMRGGRRRWRPSSEGLVQEEADLVTVHMKVSDAELA